MSVLNDGNNLPGILIDYEKELSQDYDPTKFGTTDSVLVVGTAFSGSPGIATKVYNPDMARYYFGKTYDNSTHRKATLVATVQDVYDRGCRTIYAMRIGGKDIYKDFKFCDENTDYRLRVSGLYPANITKECYMHLDTRSGLESITFFKPAEKATIAEKKLAMVEQSDAIMKTEIQLNLDSGMGRDNKAIDMIKTFNEHAYNNVLRLSIVDENGIDITSTPEAQDVKIGSLFPGVYFVGRDTTLCSAYTNLKTQIILSDADTKPYSSYTGKFYKEIIFNSDVSSEYPIYASVYSNMKDILKEVSITTAKNYDFLDTAGLIDRAFQKDTNDYEEVDLSKFEIYKRLGEGYATTAMAVDRGKDAKGNIRKPRVIETPPEDKNHITGIRGGLYATLQNAEVKYRLISCVNADDKIAGKIPKADDFKVTLANELQLLGNTDGTRALISATPKVEQDDQTMAKMYQMKFIKVDEEDLTSDIVDKIYAEKVATVIPSIVQKAGENYITSVKNALGGNTVKNGTSVMIFDTNMVGHLARINGKNLNIIENAGLAGELYAVDNAIYIGVYDTMNKVTTFVQLVPDTGTGTDVLYKNKNYMLVETANAVYVAKIKQTSITTIVIQPLGSLKTLLGNNDDKTLFYVEDCYLHANQIIVTTAATDFVSLEEFCSMMQEDESLGQMFTFELTDEGYDQKDEYLEDIVDTIDTADSTKNVYRFFQTANSIAINGVIYSLMADRETTYDFSMYIPYKTSDNFARQLAQHCAYTTLRTKNTHGIIGISTLSDVTLKSIAKKVEEVKAIEFSLYAKNYNGRMFLDQTNLPYEFGRYISIPMFQYNVTDAEGYNFLANGAGAYAGMISALDLKQSSTMQPISIATGVDYILSQTQMLALTNLGIVTVLNSLTKGLVIVDGVTMAQSTAYSKRLMVSRILDNCGELIRTAAEPYLGKINNTENRNSLRTAIDSTLKNIKGSLIYGYDFTVQNMNSYTTDAKIDISYNIFPINEIRSVNNSITVTKTVNT